MNKGGGTQKTVSEPWKAAQPYLKDIFGRAQQISNQPNQYFPGETTVGALPSEQRAWDQLFAANNSTFGSGGLYDTAKGALGSSLAGGTNLGAMADALAPQATESLISGIRSGPGSVGRYGFSTDLNPYSLAPRFGAAGDLDASGAFERMLSGTPDYAGAQGAIDAANAPILRQLEQDIIPGLNERATFLNNGTGGIKTLNRVLPEVGERMSQNAMGILEGERQRALGAQERAAQAVSQGGMQSFGLGLDAASRQAGLEQALAGQNLATDTTNAGLKSDFLGNLLNFGSLAGQLGGQEGAQSLSALGLFPSIAQAGQMPGQTALGYGAYQRSLAEDKLQSDIDRFNFGQMEPENRLNWYSQIVNGMAGLGGTQSGSQKQGWGAGDTVQTIAALAAMFSDRRLKTDIERIGALPSGLPLYRYRFKGSPVVQIGVMADEVRERFPDAVIRDASGYDKVDYGRLQ